MSDTMVARARGRPWALGLLRAGSPRGGDSCVVWLTEAQFLHVLTAANWEYTAPEVVTSHSGNAECRADGEWVTARASFAAFRLDVNRVWAALPWCQLL